MRKQTSASIVVREDFRESELSLITFLNIDHTNDCIYSIREDLDLPPLWYELVPRYRLRDILYVFHSDGIVCLVDDPQKVSIFNPILHKCRIVPELEINNFIGLGFGYDSEAKDYKFIRIFADRCYRSEVYSVNNNSWKVITMPDGMSLLTPLRKKAFYWRGALYWIGYEKQTYDSGILCFDMCDEIFHVTAMPEPITDVEGIGGNHMPVFTVWNDSLALYYQYSDGESCFLEIRVLDMNFKKNIVAPFWTRKLLLRPDRFVARMLPLIQNNGFLIRDCAKQLSIYNLHTEKFRDVLVENYYRTWED